MLEPGSVSRPADASSEFPVQLEWALRMVASVPAVRTTLTAIMFSNDWPGANSTIECVLAASAAISGLKPTTVSAAEVDAVLQN